MADKRIGAPLQGQALIDSLRAEHVRDQLRIGFHRGRYNRDVGILLAAADLRISRGHNDTCSSALNGEYECDCGHAELHKATIAVRANGLKEKP